MAQKTRFELVLPVTVLLPLQGSPLSLLGTSACSIKMKLWRYQIASGLHITAIVAAFPGRGDCATCNGTTLLNGEPLEPLGYFCIAQSVLPISGSGIDFAYQYNTNCRKCQSIFSENPKFFRKILQIPLKHVQNCVRIQPWRDHYEHLARY